MPVTRGTSWREGGLRNSLSKRQPARRWFRADRAGQLRWRSGVCHSKHRSSDPHPMASGVLLSIAFSPSPLLPRSFHNDDSTV
jgi:hypothetical protein